jgi:NAD(P)-dependent dehydrogenase (short-subunit alcohol dehydrogenase family)
MLPERRRRNNRKRGGLFYYAGTTFIFTPQCPRIQPNDIEVVNYRQNRAAAERGVAAIEAAGARAIAVAADVAMESDVMRLFEMADRMPGALSGLVNNAGILETQMCVDTMDALRIHRIFAANVVGAFICVRGRATHVDKARRHRRFHCQRVFWRGTPRLFRGCRLMLLAGGSTSTSQAARESQCAPIAHVGKGRIN